MNPYYQITGENRPPNKGEWFTEGGRLYKALQNLTENKQIVKKVNAILIKLDGEEAIEPVTVDEDAVIEVGNVFPMTDKDKTTFNVEIIGKTTHPATALTTEYDVYYARPVDSLVTQLENPDYDSSDNDYPDEEEEDD